MTKDTKHKVHQFDAEVGKVLQLMIHSLYTNKDIFLRELISNASDACDKLRYSIIENPEWKQEDEEFKISISLDREASCMTITDNGIGMSEEDMIANLGTIASSGTQKFMESVSKNDNASPELIGQFGVGFYSAFMVAEDVTVISKKAGAEKSYIWNSQGEGSYTISENKDKDVKVGTAITLKMRDKEIGFLEKYRVEHIIKTYSDHISFLIEVAEKDSEPEVVNNRSALWVRPKSEITDEQYDEFYRHVSHSPDKPWLRMHNKAEGTIEYTSLLYIPSTKPFDLFNPDRATRVKLYVKRVFITDQGVGLVPEYMRFIRGVVDSEDLPLNVSRETLQDNIVIGKIKKSIVKKILSSLKKKAADDKKAYSVFWNNFGEVMKEGLCEGVLEEKEQLLEVCRFRTTKSDGDLVSLDEYIENMMDSQNEIFYITGDSKEKLIHSPLLEGFKKRDIEVLLLSDHVDDFWVNVISNYKGKDVKHVSTVSDLDAIKKIESEDSDETDKKEEGSTKHEELLKYIKDTLGDLVKDVKISNKLIDSPSCIVSSEGGMSSRMERYLMEQKQLNARSPKIFEINPGHSIIKKISSGLKEEDNQDIKDLVWIVFDQACIAEGEGVNDAHQFIQRVNKFIDRI